MRGVRTALGALLVVCALIAVAAASAKSDAVAKKDKEPVAKHGGHILWTPQLKQQFGLRKQAMKDKLAGKASGKVHKVKGKFVEMSLERTDKIFVILTEFGWIWLFIAAPIVSIAVTTVRYIHGRLSDPPRPAGVLPWDPVPRATRAAAAGARGATAHVPVVYRSMTSAR